jgi:farnesyl-diphosphate farnesyltransferase
MRSTNPREVSLIFREYARKIHAKALPRDPNFIGISVACGKVCLPSLSPTASLTDLPTSQIEAWCEHYYPSFVSITAAPSAATGTSSLSQAIDPNDARGRTFLLAEKADHERASKLRIEAMRAEIASGKRTAPPANDGAVWELVMYLGGGALVLLGVIGAVVYLIMQFSD